MPCLLASLCALLAATALSPASAGAASVKPFLEDFGPAAQPSFADPKGLAFDPATGDLLVIDTGAKTLSRWHADGTPSDFAALGTNVIDGKEGADATPSGSVIGTSTGTPEVQVAVDRSGGPADGNIYLTNTSGKAIDVFSGGGEFLTRLSKYLDLAGSGEERSFGEICGVAVDPAGALYVGDYTNNQVHKYVSSANPPSGADNVANFNYGRPCTMAAGAGPSDGLLFVHSWGFGHISKLDSASGEVICEITLGILAEPSEPLARTVAVDPASGRLFVGNDNREVREYAPPGGAGEPWVSEDAGDPCASEVARVESPSFVQGVAPAEGGSNLYLSRAGKAQVEIYGAPVSLPVAVTEPASEIGPTSATLNGALDPEGVAVSECRFDYVVDADYDPGAPDPYAAGEAAPCAQSPAAIGSGSEPVAVSADIGGLIAGELYHFRLVAVNAGGAATGADETLATRLAPEIVEEWVAGATHSEATIKARIDANHYPTTFRVEYGPSASLGQSTGELQVGAGGQPRTVTAILTGLDPQRTYQWRVVASSENGESVGPGGSLITYAAPGPRPPCANDAFRYGAGAALPDCRAYELVSPLDKGGGDAVPIDSGHRQAAAGGERLTYTSGTAFGDAQRGDWANQYLATRTASGWASHALNPHQGTTVFDVAGTGLATARDELDLGNGFQLFTPDLCFALMADQNYEPLTPEAIPGYTNGYLRGNCGAGADGYEPFTRGSSGSPFSVHGDFGVQLWIYAYNLTPDRRYAAFSSRAALTANAANAQEAGNQLYVYDFATDRLRVASVLPDGAPSREDNQLGTGEPVNNQATLARALADDASRLFWTTDATGDGGSLYLRANPAAEQSALDGEGKCTEAAKACTVAIFERTSTEKGRFWTASADGSRAVYSTGSGASAELFELDVEALVAGATSPATKIAGEAGGVAGASEDLSHLYFTSREALAGAGTNERGEEAQAGEWNLYLRRGGVLTFIATVDPEDRGSTASLDSPEPRGRSTRVSPDGRHLAFMSVRPLSGYDNTDAASGEADREVFLYAADTGKLLCVSCNPSGSRPRGANLGPDNAVNKRWTAAWIPSWESPAYAKRALSADGKRLFFNAFDALVPADRNNAQDVYQWEAPGAGGCRVGGADYSPRNEGCVSLISNGRGGESVLFDASADGADVFIETAASLDPRDPGQIDVYDARVGGGFAPPAPPAPECAGDACQPVPPAPAVQSPNSASFHGTGNLQGSARSCRRPARGAKRLANRAKRLRRAARRAKAPARSRVLRRRARRSAKRAKRASRSAKRCRRANRRAAR